jgi:DNA-binding FadR family transcriptional regulator
MPTQTKLDRTSVPDQIFRATSAAILSGRYSPGEKLPTQRALAEQFGVNMTTVREAVKKLEQLRLVEVRHGDAMRVRDWRRHGSLDLVAQMLFGAGVLDTAVLANVMEARRLLLTECGRLAAVRATPAQVARLSELAGQLAAPNEELSAQLIDFEFFEELASASGNLVFTLVITSIRDVYLENAAAFGAIVGDREQSAPLYAAVVQAVENKDADQAASCAAELAGLQEDRLLTLIELGAGS